MGAIASHKAQRLPFECVSDPKTGPAAYGVFGLVIAYIIVLALAIVANLPVEKFEAIMNVAAIAGFTVLWAAFWRSSRRNAMDHLRHDWRCLTVTAETDPPMTRKAESPSMERWGPASIIGSLNE